MQGIKIIDLFAGCGGLGLGAQMAGGHLTLSVELDKYACETLRNNTSTGHEIIKSDVCELKGSSLRKQAGASKKDPLIIIGGPPCQPFSKAAYWVDSGEESRFRQARTRGEQVNRPTRKTKAREDSRRSLVDEYWRLISESKADGFVFENVTSLLHPRNREVLDRLLKSAHSAGYYTTQISANAVEYGVPQARKRVFVLGSKVAPPVSPQKTHALSDEGLDQGLLPRVIPQKVLAPFKYKKYFEPEEVISGKWADHLKEIPPGWNYKALTEWAGHPKPSFIAETRFWNFLLKLHPEKPSWTINASPGPWTGPFHWDTRRLRIPELAALQSFPKEYEFAGSRREKVRQIGNAVPVLFAEAIAKYIMGIYRMYSTKKACSA